MDGSGAHRLPEAVRVQLGNIVDLVCEARE